MRFGGNFIQNITQAHKSKDKSLQKDILFDELAQLIENYPLVLIGALQESGCDICQGASKKKLIDATVDNLSYNPSFRNKIPLLIVASKSGALKKAISQAKKEGFSSADGKVKDFFGNIWGKVKGAFGGGGTAMGDGGSNVLENVGDGAKEGAGGGIWGVVIGTIGGVTESIFDWKTSKTNQEIANEQAKMSLYEKLLGGAGGKTNWMPIVVVGGVLLIGAIVVAVVLKNK
tara:strand:- start:386 stop:1078 length:693 start_codon:yes stop_codon:yes gene_type:complete